MIEVIIKPPILHFTIDDSCVRLQVTCDENPGGAYPNLSTAIKTELSRYAKIILEE